MIRRGEQSGVNRTAGQRDQAFRSIADLKHRNVPLAQAIAREHVEQPEVRSGAKAEDPDAFSFELLHGFDGGTSDQSIIQSILHAGDHHGVGSL